MKKIKALADFLKKDKKITISLGEFVFVKQIGLSANGYVGEFTLNDLPFAIKFLISEDTGDSELIKRKRFIAEYINVVSLPANRFTVKNIAYDTISISSSKEELSIPIIVMKKYDSTLKSYQALSNKKEDFIKLYEFLMKSIKFIHSNGIVHRDLKPENIFIDGNNFILGDFGIAYYEPEKFTIKDITVKEKKERLGNRVFSAPEQENPDVSPAPTMDIYAIGQLLQWFVTSETHKGTGRKSISKYYENVNEFDGIIELCLKHDPKQRFQNIDAIEEYFQKYQEIEEERDPFNVLYKFNEVLRKSFPKKLTEPIVCIDQSRIDNFFRNLKNEEEFFGNSIWYTKGYPNMYFRLKQSTNGNWCLDADEYKIEKLFISYDESNLNDFVIVKYASADPFIIDGTETYYAGIIDETTLITATELENGHADIDGVLIDLDTKPNKRMIIRQKSRGYLIISTKHSCAIQKESDEYIDRYISELITNEDKAIEIFQEFKSNIRKYKPHYIKMYL